MSLKELKPYVVSSDFIIALIISILPFIFLKKCWIDIIYAIKIYEVGISVLAIVFSVFFAASAIIISGSDNDFIKFLEEDESYTQLINFFKFTLIMLFLALLYSIVIFEYFSYRSDILKIKSHSVFWLVIFTFLFFYSLLSTMLVTIDSFKYAKRRANYLRNR